MNDAADAQHLPPHAATPPATKACLNCGAPLTARFCGECGQKAQTERLTMGHLLREVPHGIFHVDRGFVPTVKALLVNPGEVLANYLAGKRARYFNPLTLLVICAGICGAAWAMFPLRPELFMPLVTDIAEGDLFTGLAQLWFKLVGATQLVFLPVAASTLYGVWAVVLHRTLVAEGKAEPSRRISWFWTVLPADAKRLAADPRHILLSEAIVAAAFITAISLLITAVFAPLAALARTPGQYAVVIVVAGLMASYPPLRLLRTATPAGRVGWGAALFNAVLFSFFTPCGYLLYLITLEVLSDFGAWLVRLMP